jgi:biopolymer transport protein ExbD
MPFRPHEELFMQIDSEDEMVSGINVTPLVDITLVLLIIFMVTATFITTAGLKVNLPKAATTEAAATASLTVTVNASGQLYLMKDAVDDHGLSANLEREAKLNPGVRVTLAADKALPYGTVVHILDLIKQAGVTRVALSSER